MTKPSLSRLRRGLLLLSGLVAVAAVLAACGSSSNSSSNAADSGASSPSASSTGTSAAVKRADAVLAQSASAPIVWHGPTSAPPFQKNKTIAMVNTTADAPDESSVRSWKALVAATKAVGWNAVEISKTDLNDALIEAVQQHVSGIFTYGADQTTLEGLDAAKKAGIPVIAGYTAITPQANKLFTHIINQHYPEQGADSAAAVVALTKDNAKIGIFTVPPDPSNPSSLDVTLDSFKSALASYGSGAKIVGTTNFDLSDLATPSLLAQRAVAFLQSHPDVNVIWTPFAQPAEDIDEPIIAKVGAHMTQALNAIEAERRGRTEVGK